MRILILGLALLAVSCATKLPNRDSLVGTWVSGGYYLRIYQDGRVAQWPSPPDGDVAWSRQSEGELLWDRDSQYSPNPRVERAGSHLVMVTTVGKMMLDLVTPDLEPGQRISNNQAEQIVAPNRSLPPTLNSTSSVRGSED